MPEISFKLLEKNDPDSIEILKNALSSHGFFSVIDHGLSSLLAENCYKASEKFFNLDLELKLKYHHKNLKGARGYTPNGIETAVGENVPDQKEFWHHGPIVDETYDNR
ncbi:MAG: 2-oxoglutarate and iron-dependent oxygenase domain-containing protein, partial [Candidatus Neomarinimicrobiota bacterium]